MSLDGSDLAVRAIGTGIKIARRRLAPLVLLRVVPPDPRLGMFGIAISEQSTERETALSVRLVGGRAPRAHGPNPGVHKGSLERHPARGFVEAEHRLSPRLTSMASRG